MPRKLRLVQLPVPPPAALVATGNVPLAAGCLAVAARVHGLDRPVELDVLDPDATDAFGDALLADLIARDEPEWVGFSLYLWNSERSLHLAREVKRRAPRTTVLVGGPEVSSDNPFLLRQPGWDVAVAGEAEQSFARLLQALVERRDPAGLPGVAVRRPLGPSAFAPQDPAAFGLEEYPSPYLEGLVPVDPRRSTYVETVRGCRSHCTFCFYPRSSTVLRSLDVGASGALVAALREKGAREVVFLDPTFNHRPGFEDLLGTLAAANPDRALTFFAEVRAEGLTVAHAKALRRAGFGRLEIGLQSVNRETLRRVRRGGSPEKVAEAARMLRGEGIELLVDLIIGLPGDGRDDVLRGMDFLAENGLAADAQVFALSLLPGTAMRGSAEADGVVFDPAPPYRVRRTATLSEETIVETLVEAERRLGRRLDEWPRPHLVDAPGPRARDVFRVGDDDAGAPGARHAALWAEGVDLFGSRAAILAAIDARLQVDPHATLDVVLRPREPFPLDLLDVLRRRLASAPQGYLSRALSHRGEDLQRRIAIVLNREFPADWVEAARARAQVFRDGTLEDALRNSDQLGGALPGARIVGTAADPAALERLAARADGDCVAFADRAAETAWQERTLGFRDAG